MRNYLLALTLMLVVGTAAMPAAPKHRHQHTATAVALKDSAGQGIEAYSDTSSVDSAVVDSADSYYTMAQHPADEGEDFPPFVEKMLTTTWFMIFIIFVLIILGLAPLLLIAWVVGAEQYNLW